MSPISVTLSLAIDCEPRQDDWLNFNGRDISLLSREIQMVHKPSVGELVWVPELDDYKPVRKVHHNPFFSAERDHPVLDIELGVSREEFELVAKWKEWTPR